MEKEISGADYVGQQLNNIFFSSSYLLLQFNFPSLQRAYFITALIQTFVINLWLSYHHFVASPFVPFVVEFSETFSRNAKA